MKLEFSQHAFEKYTNVMKIRQVRVELFHADGRGDGQTEIYTDMTKLIVTFRNFSSARKKMETSILELQKLLLVEGLHSEFAEISRYDAFWRFSFGVRRHGYFGSGISSLDFLEMFSQ